MEVSRKGMLLLLLTPRMLLLPLRHEYQPTRRKSRAAPRAYDTLPPNDKLTLWLRRRLPAGGDNLKAQLRQRWEMAMATPPSGCFTLSPLLPRRSHSLEAGGRRQ